jgi:hypothetical protein
MRVSKYVKSFCKIVAVCVLPMHTNIIHYYFLLLIAQCKLQLPPKEKNLAILETALFTFISTCIAQQSETKI